MLEIGHLDLGFETENGFYPALFDVSFSLEKGKMHALVGESGCGKTMSAMSILRLLPKTAKITGGKICFDGQNLLDLPEKDMQKIRGAKIALIPQDPMTSLNPLFTIGEQLTEVIEAHHNLSGENIYKKAVESLEMVQMPCAELKMKSYPHELSGGMKQRAIIAMALSTNAEVLIADEPTTALDVTIQAQIMNLLNEIKPQTSILLITHDLALVSEYADEVSVMYAGRIVENAPAKDFFRTPNHPYSTALLKALPSDTTDKLQTIEGQPPTIQQTISGCRFHPRCENCMDICKTYIPELKLIGENHYSACHLNN